jgi:hypothetical protein
MTITYGGTPVTRPAARPAARPVAERPAATLPRQRATSAVTTTGTTTAGTITAGTITAGTITAGTITAGTATAGSTRPRPRIRLAGQIALVAAAVAAYFLVRGATEAAYGEALRHAQALVDLERTMGIYWEPALQDALADSPRVRAVLNAVYIYGHWPVIVVTLLFLARQHPAVYLRARNAMLLSGGIGLIVFVTYPVAPPRLAELGMVDTVSVASGAYRVLQPTMFTNQYAALPSLHVGWDLIIGLALLAAARESLRAGRRGRGRLLRIAGFAMPVAMVVAVVLTANHYVLDAVAGAALTATCWVLVDRLARRRAARRRTAYGSTAYGSTAYGRTAYGSTARLRGAYLRALYLRAARLRNARAGRAGRAAGARRAGPTDASVLDPVPARR